VAEILSQDEVDLLLNAVSEGEVRSEVSGTSADAGLALSTYDFRRPERVSKEQLKGLQSLFEAFSRELGVVLPPFLRTVVRIDLTSIDQLTYDEFILSVARPTSLSIIDMAPLEGSAVLELSPGVVFPIVDRVLGGRGTALSAARELTEIEERIINRIVLMILDSWKRAWEQMIEFNMAVINQESDPLIVQIVPGSEMVILVGYEIFVGENVGAMNMCIPLLVLNPILDQISLRTDFQRKLSSKVIEETRRVITQSLMYSEVDVEPILGSVRLTLSDLARLQRGDVIPLDSNVSDPVPVRVGGVKRFLAQPGRKGEQSAVQLVSLVRD
jgi:flagellar motor switch protein FliM